MNAVFADSFFYIAFLDRKDAWHPRVHERSRGRSDFLITTRWVLVETANALSSPRTRTAAGEFLEQLERDPGTIIVEPGEATFREGWRLWRNRPDKEWSLTDCVSFAVMKERGLSEALTRDHHYVQAGFRLLFSD